MFYLSFARPYGGVGLRITTLSTANALKGLFTHVILNLYAFLSSMGHKRKYFEGLFLYNESQWGLKKTHLNTDHFQNISVLQMKESHTGLE